MDSICDIDVESLFSTYGEKYTHEIEVLTQLIEICLLEDSIHNNQNKQVLLSNLKRRIVINCTIEKYQSVLDDIEIFEEYDGVFDVELVLARAEARLALFFKSTIGELEYAQNNYGHNFKKQIRYIKAINIRKWFEKYVKHKLFYLIERSQLLVDNFYDETDQKEDVNEMND
ncbi:unnamed protein product [Rotaria socialis]|uniref:Uncharacterized protein n=1 Tax=Rotaria socialis TaxID=392032 RepID=A0A821C4S2_9BILA|nr:unnamed protein product [Rotaria socialis]CAF4515155.1 unnamed protein product [Rotaria socialis]CAF4603188.1 unnamed protein product [Rotaria socialis]